jgi:hypothetical protein
MLIADLGAAAGEAHEAGQFSAEPLGGRGVNLCVGGESLNAYVYGSADEAAARAATIDPRDPSHVGNSIVSWAGSPKFWLRGNMIVLYLGTDEATLNALVTVLGDPFAVGQGLPPLGVPDC